MERVLFAIGVGIGKLLVLIVELIFYALTSRRPKQTGLSLPLAVRFEHTHIVAGSGHGKTQLLQHLIATHDLAEVADGECSLIVIDSQGDLIRNILRLAEFSPSHHALSERLIYIDPTDILHPPCLNLFDFGLSRLQRYSPLERETLINGAISLYEYLFGALLGAELTNRQGVIFRYLARLLMVVPGATIYTLMDFMEDPQLVRPYLSQLDPSSARFFQTLFLASGFDNTRQQILMRLWGVLSNTVLARMFAHQQNRLNLFRAMNRGSVILINTAKDLLKQEGCSLFGRFCIALLTQATQERAAVKQDWKRKPTMVYIDEAHDYFEEGAGIELLLNTARKYNVGLILSHQNLEQFPRRLAATVMASTAIKFAGGVSFEDARTLAREMHTTPEFLQSMQKGQGATNFALWIRNHIGEAQVQTIPFGTLEGKLRMSDADYDALIADNRQRYCAPVDPRVLAGSVAVSHANNTFQLTPQQPII
jgi:hypothetical protein